jgi:2-dehydro-3-deoxyphosphooctonate aldolase (KDO 8-P synthase)
MSQHHRYLDTKEFSIQDRIRVGGDAPLFLIAGPCGIESADLLHEVAGRMKEITTELELPYIFKSSYDKANRTSIDSFRGPGLEEGLSHLEDVKQTYDVPVTSDVHGKEQVGPASDVLDVLQIPAFLCRQTDLICSAARSGCVVNVKKGQFLEPSDATYIVEKAEESGNQRVIITERGTCFGHGDLVNDFRSIPIMQSDRIPVVYDATHSAQQPASGDDQTGGTREYIPEMIRAAVATGCNGVFMEVHPEPDQALSDAATQYPLDRVKPVLESMLEVRSTLA